MKTLALVAAIFLPFQFHCAAGTTNAADLRQLVQQYLPGCTLKPDGAAQPRTLVSASGETLDLLAAARENAEPRKVTGYWFTPNMAFLSRRRIEVDAGATNGAAGVVQLLHAISRGTNFVKQNSYRAFPVEGGWLVEVDRNPTNQPALPAMPPYELLSDDGRHIVQIRERSFPYSGSPRVYGNTVRSVYEREMKVNGGANYQATVEKELAKAWETEKPQPPAKPAAAPKK